MKLGCIIPNIDLEPGWASATGPDINPVAADGQIVQLPTGIRLYCSGAPYAGWLAKFVSPFVYPFQYAAMSFGLLIDPATIQQAQVIEFDSKITDADGWTYDFSAQVVIIDEWMFQVADKDGNWVDTGIKIMPPVAGSVYQLKVNYFIDFENHTGSVQSLTYNNILENVSPTFQKVPAKQLGWLKSSIVTQLQQCNNHLPGAHAEEFRTLTYALAATQPL